MTNRWISQTALAIATLFLATLANTAVAQDLPKAETILDKYVEVTGGKEAYMALKNRKSTGTLSIPAQGIAGSITVYEAPENKQLAVIEIEGIGAERRGTNGQVAWSVSDIQGAVLQSGEEKEQTIRDATFYGDLNWRDLYNKVETVGREEVDGVDCYKVALTAGDNTRTAFYGVEDGLIYRVESVAKISNVGEFPVVSTPEDYRKVDGVLRPFRATEAIEALGNQAVIVIELDNVEHNVELPEDIFELPDEIKELVKGQID